MKSKTPSFDIAYRAGVSQSTVSRALRNSPLVNEETRKRIQAIAKEMHYTVDKNASNLRSQHSDTLAVLLFEDPTSDDSQINPFFLSMIGSITRACSQYGYDLLISFQQASNDWHADFEDSRKADGIILLGYGDYLDYAHRLNKLVEQGTHFVRWGPVLPVQPGITIGCDNYLAGRELTEHLLLQGHRRIAADRLDLQVVLRRLESRELVPRRGRPQTPADSSRTVAARVQAARRRMQARNPGGVTNGQLQGEALLQLAEISEPALTLWQGAVQQRRLSARAAERLLRVARTIADLEGSGSRHGGVVEYFVMYG